MVAKDTFIFSSMNKFKLDYIISDIHSNRGPPSLSYFYEEWQYSCPKIFVRSKLDSKQPLYGQDWAYFKACWK